MLKSNNRLKSLTGTKYVTIIIVLLLIFIQFPNLSKANMINESSHVDVLITFKDHIDTKVVETEGGKVTHQLPLLNMISADIPSKAISELKAHPNIKDVTEDQPVAVTKSQTEDWGVQTVLPYKRSTYKYTGKGVKVAVIDTGVDKTHTDLKIAGGVNVIGQAEQSNYADDNGHGTEVSGVIAAQNNSIGVAGVAPNVQLYAVKALGSDGVGYLSDIIAGIQWCINNNIDIINMSFSSPEGDPYLQKAIQLAYQKGILMVGAAGNDGDPNKDTVEYPAKYDDVIAVGAVDAYLKRASFSGAGSTLEVTAPGVGILSTAKGNGYVKASGTSFSTPLVAGLLALYKEQYPTKSNAEIRQLLDSKAVDLGTKGRDPLYGYGIALAPDDASSTVERFLDVTSDYWARDDITYLASRSIIKGYENDKFRPGASVTRAQAAAMIGRAQSLDGTQRSTKFTDVDASSFASGYINILESNEIIKGYPDDTFRPNQPLTR